MDKRIMIEMAKNKIDIAKGETSSGNKIKRGRPSRHITLTGESGEVIDFESLEECAQSLGASLITVKRALKGKQENDSIIIKKKQYILK